MTYAALKALHVTAMVVWIGGMIAAAALLPGADAARAAAVREAFRRFVTPAMIAALSLGLWLAWDGGWFREAWLLAKLVAVLALTGVHGAVSGWLRRAAGGLPTRAPDWMPTLVIALLAVAAWLAIAKPALR